MDAPRARAKAALGDPSREIRAHLFFEQCLSVEREGIGVEFVRGAQFRNALMIHHDAVVLTVHRHRHRV